MAYSWPGNVRELDQVLVYYSVHGRLPKRVLAIPASSDWRDRVQLALTKHRGNKAAAARELGISRKTLYDELQRRASADG
jgi:transcriptional regulator of acetoin/glycerol metabolism